MKTNSNSYTIIYSIIIVVIVAFLLAFVSTSLREKQDKNVALDKKKQILYSLNIRGLNDADAEAKYKEVIVADEIGGPGDAEALADARRCGAAIVATAHGSGFEAMETRPALRSVAPLFDRAILLGDVPGRVKAVRAIAASTGNRCDAGM
jgi:hypothetical protein